MLWVAVAGLVEGSLPAAEVAQREPAIVRHLRAPLFIFHYKHFHHDQVDGVLDAGVLVDSGCHGHQGQDVVLLEAGSGERSYWSHSPRLLSVTASCCGPFTTLKSGLGGPLD